MRMSIATRTNSASIKKSILAVLLVPIAIIVLVSYASLFSRQQIVTVTDSGFYPTHISILKGNKIIFKNSGEHLHWPASNFHPAHTQYLTKKKGCIGGDFDACHGLRNGETYIYTLDNVGEWGIHDHLYPQYTLDIEVYQQQPFVFKLFDIVYNFYLQSKYKIAAQMYISSPPSKEVFLKWPYDQKRDFILELSKKDPIVAWAYLKKVALVHDEAIDQVHEFAHIIGRDLYNVYGSSGLLKCDNSFAYGCFHGVASEMLLRKINHSIIAMQAACNKTVKINDAKVFGCIHGLGHGLDTFYNLDVVRALKDCDKLDSSFRKHCYHGVFMENTMSAPAFKIDMQNPWKFCTDLETKYQVVCAVYLPDLIARSGNDTQSLVTTCLNINNVNLKLPCAFYFGYITTLKNIGNKEKIVEYCKTVSEKEGQAYCMMAAARQVKFSKFLNWEKTASDLCKEVASSYQIDCNEVTVVDD